MMEEKFRSQKDVPQYLVRDRQKTMTGSVPGDLAKRDQYMEADDDPAKIRAALFDKRHKCLCINDVKQEIRSSSDERDPAQDIGGAVPWTVQVRAVNARHAHIPSS